MRFSAQATVEKKKMYYNMRVKTIHRNLTTLKNRLSSEKKTVLQLPENKIKALFYNIKSVSAVCTQVSVGMFVLSL